MTTALSLNIRNGALVVLDPTSVAVIRTILLQYPDTLKHCYQVKGARGDGTSQRAQPFRLKGPAIETIKLAAEIDATDSLEHPEQNANAVQYGIAPQLAALESLVNPVTAELLALSAQSQWGTLETNGVTPRVLRRAQRSDALLNSKNVAIRRKSNAAKTRGGPRSCSAPSHPGGLA